MRILFVAFPDSVHTARWINQVSSQPWDIHLFPCYAAPPHPLLRRTQVHQASKLAIASRRVLRTGWRWLARPRKAIHSERTSPCTGCPSRKSDAPAAAPSISSLDRLREHFDRVVPNRLHAASKLARVIRETKPDIVHSLELQHAGYLALRAREQLGEDMPPWIVSNWGSDIFLFGRSPTHAAKIRQLLAQADYYCCECHRDVALARKFGFQGSIWPVQPNAGGFDLDAAARLRQPGRTSDRRVVALKGYHDWSGRALVGLQALAQCADALQGYELQIYNATDDPHMKRAVTEFVAVTKVPARLVPRSSHEDMLRLHGRARISIGLSISDGASTSFLESLVMGSFPIQSQTACADEWVQDGTGGILVHPEDVTGVAAAIRRALTDDALVNQAAELNSQTARDRLAYAGIQANVIAHYERVYAGIKASRPRQAA